MARTKKEHLHDRIEHDVTVAVDHLIASKLRKRNYGENEQQAAILADCCDDIVGNIKEHLLKHYTIRDRQR